MIIPPNNKMIQYSSSDMDSLLAQYKENDGPREIKTNEDFIERNIESDNETSQEVVTNEILQEQPVMVPTQSNMSFSYNAAIPRSHGYTTFPLLQNNMLSPYELHHHQQHQQHQQQQHQQHQQQLLLLQENMQEHRQMMTQVYPATTTMLHETGSFYSKTPPLYYSPPQHSPDQSPRSEPPGTPDKRSKLNITISSFEEKQESGSSPLPSHYAQNLPSPSNFFPNFYNNANSFIALRETGARTEMKRSFYTSEDEITNEKKIKMEV
ncbi:hypothetical protein G6F37_000714 [Rhizopus arrhizus]|nr:hypothetical protein G6F38_000878 [Rhizopus arrhizus]KAG1163962.1 hypothetical protein G6F37_000714 [Rhizopus arrhizus]